MQHLQPENCKTLRIDSIFAQWPLVVLQQKISQWKIYNRVVCKTVVQEPQTTNKIGYDSFNLHHKCPMQTLWPSRRNTSTDILCATKPGSKQGRWKTFWVYFQTMIRPRVLIILLQGRNF